MRFTSIFYHYKQFKNNFNKKRINLTDLYFILSVSNIGGGGGGGSDLVPKS